MAFAISIDDVVNLGSRKMVHGTFTSDDGDDTLTLAPATHGMNDIIMYQVDLDSGAHRTDSPKIVNSAGTLTVTWLETLGVDGRWVLIGR